MKDKLSEFFKIFPWPSDPETTEGKEYFNSTIKNMEKLFEHIWFKDILKKEKIKILEICAGAGFGGVALAKLILEKKLDVELIITDLRKDILLKAKKFGEKTLGKKVLTKMIDAREVQKLKKKFDIVLMYGLSTPHFNPWEIIKVFIGVTESLDDNGIFIIDELDRRSGFFTRGYQYLLAEGNENKFIISFHSDYDIIKGTFSRTFFNPILSKKPITMELYFWSLAEIGALTFLFFEDVDFVPLGSTRHFILGYKPRRLLTYENLKEPLLFRKNIGV